MPKSWSELKQERANHPDAQAGYERARVAYEFGRRVRERREELGLTQVELSRLVGTSQPAIARMEAGGTQPTLETISALSRALHATWLISPEGITSSADDRALPRV